MSVDADKSLVRAVVAVARSADPCRMYKDVAVSNAIVRLLDDMGLDGHWFTFGPYHGWYMGEQQIHWTVLDLEENKLTKKGERFHDALALLADGRKDALVDLWTKVGLSK